MYNVKGPSKIVAKTRRGLSQNIDNFREHRNNNMKGVGNDEERIHGPKPVFHVSKRGNYNNNNYQKNNNYPENKVVIPQHKEIIKFINESWNSIANELEANYRGDIITNGKKPTVVYYVEEPSSELEDFKPFDLDSWWGKRIYTYITGSINGNC